jgi:UDP-N-acetylglucosamine:LPS N-acetylglucosamine transferase
MVNADVIISRSGYSTIMDIAMLHKKAIFVPTPGQTEQLYLAKYYYDQNMAYAMHQHQFDLNKALGELAYFKGISIKNDSVNWSELFNLF